MLALAFAFMYCSYTAHATANAGFFEIVAEDFSNFEKKRASPSLGSPLRLKGRATNRDAL